MLPHIRREREREHDDENKRLQDIGNDDRNEGDHAHLHIRDPDAGERTDNDALPAQGNGALRKPISKTCDTSVGTTTYEGDCTAFEPPDDIVSNPQSLPESRTPLDPFP